MKKLLALVALASATGVARRYLKSRDAIAQVADDLRSPLLPLLTGPITARTLPLVRLLFESERRPDPASP